MPYYYGQYFPYELPGLAEATTAVTTPQVSATSGQAGTAAQPAVKYTVKSGDTVSAIAAANGMTTKELLAINPQLTSNPKYNGGSTIFSGTKIITSPAVKAQPAPTPAPTPTPPVSTDTTPVEGDGKSLGDQGTATEGQGEGANANPAAGTLLSTRQVDDGTYIITYGTYADGNGGTYENEISRVKKTTQNPVNETPPSTVENAALNSVLEQVAALTKQLTDLQTAQAAEAAKPKPIGVKTVRKTGGVVETVEVMSDGSQGKVIDSYTDFGAKDAVTKMFANAGLGQTFIDSLAATIDKVYDENIMPTDEQILNSIYSSDAYKTRFAANEAIKKRMAEGKGLPGDRLLSPAEYIKTEEAYREVLQSAGLPTGFYDTQDDFTKLIENSISTAELTERVNIAQNALNNADKNIVDALKNYYGMTTGDLTAYLLDKDKAFNVINSRYQYTTEEAKKIYGSAEIGGAAARAGMEATKEFANEIYSAGKGSMAEQAFQGASRQQADYKRLLGLYGQEAGQEDLAREALALAGGTDVALKTKKLASKERAKFQTRSALDRTSLGRATAADV